MEEINRRNLIAHKDQNFFLDVGRILLRCGIA